ncbi:MAG: NAD(P)H-dependent oxidoreductase subunit E [Chloroflexota bacterium]
MRASPPSDDKRWLIVNATMRRHGYQSHALIETLHTVQESFGFIDVDALRFVATSLNLPLSRVLGVTTFYHYFNTEARGEHTCVVCTGTACYIKGGNDILAAIAQEMGVMDGETTDDNQLTVMTARCIGACGLAPAVVLDDDILANYTSERIIQKLKEVTGHGA